MKAWHRKTLMNRTVGHEQRHVLGYNDNGVINSNTSNNKIVLPTTVPLGLPVGLTVTEVVASATSAHVCAIISDGSLMCWGRGDFMQTATGQTTTATSPAFVKANW
jgi:alpha-tubulin suppressor-like RCC1 family protein